MIMKCPARGFGLKTFSSKRGTAMEQTPDAVSQKRKPQKKNTARNSCPCSVFYWEK